MKKIYLLLIIMGAFLMSSDMNAQPAEWLWAKSAGANSYDYGVSVAADASGNSLFAGQFSGTIVFENTYSFTSQGASDIFLVKYRPEGTVKWAKSFGGSETDSPGAVATDAAGNVYLAGYFKSSQITFGAYTLNNAGGNTFDLYVVKLDTAGNVIWAKSVGGTGDDRAYAITVDRSGNCIISGYFVSQVVLFGNITLINSGALDVFIAKYNTYGFEQWAHSATGTGFDYAYSAASDKEGNIYVAGSFNGSTIAFGTIVLTGPANNDAFVVKYSPAGIPLWAKQAGVNSDNSAYSVAADTLGNCYLAGSFKGSTITFGNITLTNQGHYDIFLTRYDPLGNPVWAIASGGPEEDQAKAVAVDHAGYVHLGVFFKSASISLGGQTLNNISPSTSDLAVAEYNPAGDPLLVKHTGGMGDDVPYSIATDQERNFFVAGYFSSPTLPFGNTTLTNGGTTDPFISKSSNVPVSVRESPAGKEVTVFPNPADGHLFVNLTSDATIVILNTAGQVCKTLEGTRGTLRADISALKSGMYILRVVSETEVLNGKFLKR